MLSGYLLGSYNFTTEIEGLWYIRVRVRSTTSGFVSHSPAMCNRTAPARVLIHVPPGPVVVLVHSATEVGL